MKQYIFAFILFAIPMISRALPFKCEYGFSGASAGNVALELDENGIPGDTATVALFYTPARPLSVTLESAQVGELLHLTLAKGDSNNEMIMIVYPKNGNAQKSKLMNPAAPPVVRELQGACL